MTPQNDPRPTKAERNLAAREKARRIREEQKKKEHRTKLMVVWGVVAAIVVILAVIALIVVNNVKGGIPNAGPAPAHGNANGGITLLSSTKLEDTPSVTVNVDSLPPAPTAAPNQPIIPPGIAPAPAGQPAQIVLYVDMACPHCAEFESQYSGQLKQWLDTGKATVEYRTVAYLDGESPTNYSSRAGNALAAVADTAPDKYLQYLTTLLAQQKAGGYSNDELISMAKDIGVTGIDSKVKDGTFRPFVKYTDAAARAYAVAGTPAVYVDGQLWGSTDGAFDTWAQGIINARK